MLSLACAGACLCIVIMDSVMSGLVAGALQGYFEVFFKNFKKEDFQLNLSGSETSTTLNNLGTVLRVPAYQHIVEASTEHLG